MEEYINNTENLLKDLGIGLVDGHEFKNRYNDIVDDIKAIVDKATITKNKKKIVKTMSVLREILKTKSNKQTDTTDMPELESEESTAERRKIDGKGLKILTQVKCLVDYQLL